MILTHAELKHLWWREDFQFELTQMQSIYIMIKRHPDMDSPMGNSLRYLYKALQRHLCTLQAAYKGIYGRTYNLRGLKGELWSN